MKVRVALRSSLFLLLLATVAPAQTIFVWTNANPANDNARRWLTSPGAWTNNLGTTAAPLAGGSNDYVIIFQPNATYRTFPTLGGTDATNFLLNQLVFNAGTVTIRGNDLTNLVFTASSTGQLPQFVQNSDGHVYLATGLILANDTTFSGIGYGTIFLSNRIAGAGALIKQTPGTLYIHNLTNTYTGGTVVQSGILAFRGGVSFGTGPVTMWGGTTLSNTAAVTGGLGVNNTIILTNGLVTINTASGDLRLSGLITGNGGLVKDGSGVLILTNAANTYYGPTILNGGILQLHNANSISTNNLIINNGVIRLGATNLSRALGTGVNQMQILGGESGFSALNADRTVTIGSSGSIIQWGSTYFNPNVLILNEAGANRVLTLANGLNLNGADRAIINNAGTLSVITGNITNTAGTAAGLIKGGAGTLRLDGVNTYDGSTIITGGVLRIGNATYTSFALPSGNLVLNGGAIEINYGPSDNVFSRSLGDGLNQVQLLGGTSGFSAVSAPRTFNIGGDGQMLTWGSTYFNPAALVLNGTNAGNRLTLVNSLDLNGADRQIYVGANYAVVSGMITNTAGSPAGLTKVGGGTLVVLSSTNYAYDGTTIVAGGILQLGDYWRNAGALPGPISNIFNVYFANPWAQTVTNALSGAGAFYKLGSADLILVGSNSLFAGTLAPYNGNLILDFSHPLAPVSDIGGFRSTLTLQDGTLTIVPSADTSLINTQIFRSWTLNAGWSRIIVGSDSSAFVDLTLSNLTRAAYNGGVVDFTINNASITTTQAAHYGILGGFATINKQDWATIDGNNLIVAFDGYVGPSGGAIQDNVASHVRLSGDAQITANVGINTLSNSKDGTNATVTLNGNTLRLGTWGGLLNPDGAGKLTIGASPNDGFLTAGTNVNQGGELIVLNYSTNLVTINSAITNNGTGGLTLTVAGGDVLLAGNNAFAGAFRIMGGADVTIGSNSTTLLEASVLNILDGSLEIRGTLYTRSGGDTVGNSYGDVGTLTLAGSGVLVRTNAAQSFLLGNQYGSMGVLRIQDNAVFSNRYRTYVGNLGTGIVYQTGGTFFNQDITYIGNAGSQANAGAGAVGLYYLSGGVFTNNSTLVIGNTTVGAFYQSGGDVVQVGEQQLAASWEGYGYLGLTGGTRSNAGIIRVGLRGIGVFHQYGGTNIGTSTSTMRVGEGWDQSIGSVYIRGGVFGYAGPITLGYDPGYGLGEFTVDGDATVIAGDFVMNRVAGAFTTNTLNLNGGVLGVRSVYVGATGGLNVVNFNGGTLRATITSNRFMSGLDGVYVYSGGANINNDAGMIAVIDQPFLAPSGHGITNIPWAGNLTGYLGAPYVSITGGSGTGATAVALFDYASGSVTGILIVSPGSGYAPGDTVTVTLRGGGQPDTVLGAALLGANATDGGLTKSGGGVILITTSNNTYGGNTVVNGGVLGLLYKLSNPASLTINAGAGVILGVGDANQWTADDASNIVAGLVSGAGFGFDTSLSPGNFTYGYDLANFSNFYKFGANTLILSGTNTYTGNAYVYGGALRAEWGVGLSTNNPAMGNLVLAGGVWETAGGIASNWGEGNGQFQLPGSPGGGFSGAGGFSAVDEPLTVNLGGDGQMLVWGGTNIFNPSELILNYVSANTNLTFVNSIDLRVSNGLSRIVRVDAQTATISGDITNTAATGSAAYFQKTGAGTLTLAGTVYLTNTQVRVYGGALDIAGSFIWPWTNMNSDAFIVGSNATLNISGTFTHYGRLDVGWLGGGTATVNQISGDVNLMARDVGLWLGFWNLTTNMGIYNLYGGTLNVYSNLFIGGLTNNPGVFNMTGGVLNAGGTLRIGYGYGAWTTNLYSQSGGAATVSSLDFGGNDNRGPGSVNSLVISGGVFTVTNTFTALAAASNQVANIYIGAGGVASLPAFPTARGVQSVVNVTFDGGTLSARGATNVMHNYLGRTDNVFLTPAGGTIVVGAGTNVSIAQVLQDSGGAGVFRKDGAGLLILSNDNTYTGNTIINDGTLQLGMGAAIGGILSPTVDLAAASSVLAYNRAGTHTNAGVITGSGKLIQQGSGLLVLSGNNDYSGGTVINGGALLFDSVGAVPTTVGGILVNTSAVVALSAANYGANLVPYLSTASSGLMALRAVNAAESFNFNALDFTNLILGAFDTLTYGGTYTPWQQNGTNYYRLGAYSGATMTWTGKITGTSVLEVNKGGQGGIVVLTNTNAIPVGVILGGGKLSIANYSNIVVGTPLTFAGGQLQITGTIVSNLNAYPVNWTYFAGGFDIATATHVFTVTNMMLTTGAFTKDGPGTLVLGPHPSFVTSNAITLGGGMDINNGNVVLTNVFFLINTSAAPITVGNTAGSAAKLIMGGTSIVTNAQPLLVGNVAGGIGVLAISNAAIYRSTGRMEIGSAAASTGLLNMAAGTVRNTAGGIFVGVGENSAGAIYQSGGTMFSAADFRIGTTNNSYGYYLMTGGSASNAGWFRVGSAGIGVFQKTGGLLVNTASGMLLGGGSGFTGTGVVWQAGGNMGVLELRLSQIAGSRGEFTVGAGTTVTVTNDLFMNYATGSSILNVYGTLETRIISRNATGGVAILNLDGATLRARANNNFIGGGAGGLLDGAYIWGGGLTIDSSDYILGVTQPLLAPTGYGITDTDFSTPLAGYLGAPYVAISGGSGTGATAVALFNYLTGTVTGILVTSRGVGYQPGDTVTLTLMGGGQTDAVFTATLGDNTGLSGDLIKSGRGALIFSNYNTFGGNIYINRGLVWFNDTNAIPPTATITVSNGGAVALNMPDLAANLFPRVANLTSSEGMLALLPIHTNESFNYTALGFTNLIFGAAGSFTAGTSMYTPWQDSGTNYWRLGAFTNAVLTFTNALAKGPDGSVLEINKGGFFGTVVLTSTNNPITAPVLLDGGRLVISRLADTGPSALSNADLIFNNSAVLEYAGLVPATTARSITNIGGAGFHITYGGVTLTLSGTMAGTNGFVKSGPGILTLAGTVLMTNTPNTAQGWVRVWEGTLNIASNAYVMWHSAANANSDSWWLQSNTVMNVFGTLDIGRLRVGNISNLVATVNQYPGSLVVLDADYGVMLGNSQAGNLGVYNLYGGTLSNANRLVLGLDVNGQGLFNMTGGSLWAGTLEVGRRDTNRSSTNIFVQSGGTAITTNLYVGSLTNHLSYLIVSNGSFTATRFTHFGGSADTLGVNAYAVIYIGTGAVVSLPNFPEVRGSNSYAQLTIDGGTLSAGYITGALANNYLGRTDNAFITGNGANFVVGAGTNVFITQVLQETGPAAIRKFGNGLLVLSNQTPQTGGFFVREGALAFGSTVIGSAVTVYTNATAGFVFGDGDLQNFLATQVTARVESAIAVTPLNQTAGVDFNALNYTNVFLGAVGDVSYTGLYKPWDDTYRFGGGAGTLTYHAVIGGSSNVIIGGGQPITVVFTATNEYSGFTRLNNGTLSVGSLADQNGNIHTNSLIIFAGGALQYTGGDVTLTDSRVFTNIGGIHIDVAGSNTTVTLDVVIPGDGGFIKSGAGTLTFNDHPQVFTRGLTINAGFLQLASGDDPIPTDNFIVVNGGVLDIGGGTQHTTNYVLFIGDNIRVQNGTIDSGDFDFQAAGGTISANLAGPVGLIKITTNVLLLSGNNTFTGPVVVNTGLLAIDNASALGSGAKVITNAAVIQFNNPMSVAADKTMVMIVGTNLVPVSGAGSVWNGPMILDPGTNTFNVTTNGIGAFTPDFTVNGVISGVGVLLKLGPGMLELTATNTYSGGTRINAGTLSVAALDRLGSGGLIFGGGTLRYTGSGTEVSGLTITNISAPIYDIADPAGRLVITGPVLSAHLALTKLGQGALQFSNVMLPWAGVTIRQGELYLRDSVVTSSTTMVVGNLSNAAARLVLDSVIVTNIGELHAATVTPTAYGELIMTNNTFYFGNSWVQIGTRTNSGVFRMFGGTMIITNWGTGLLAGNAGATGAIYQTAGDIISYGDVRVGYTAGGYGFYEFAGGSATVSNWTRVPSGSMGLMYVSGGVYTNNLRPGASGILMGDNAGGRVSTGVYYQTGGTVLVNQFRLANVTTNRSEVTIAGGTLTVDETFYVNYQTASTNIINLLQGGTLQAGWINRRQTGGISFFNFDGGVLRAGNLPDAWKETYGIVLMGVSNRFFNGAYVWPGGAIIDTAGLDVEIRQPLLAPFGYGVDSVTLGDPITGYLGAPYVAISGGGGTGATAVALFDSTSGSVTGILVTSRGIGYTSAPTVTLTGGGRPDTALSATIATNTSGGLTKRGDGILTLTTNMTYRGATVIEAGTLKLSPTAVMTNTVRFELMAGAFLDVNELGASTLTLAPGQELKGSGTVLGSVDSGSSGIITPGNSIGTLTITGDLMLWDGVQLRFDLQSPGNSDRVIVSNTMVFTDMATNWFVFAAGGDLQVGDYVLFHAEGTFSGSWLLDGGTNFDLIGTSGKSGYLWLSGDEKDVMLTVVPEPSTFTLVGTGLLALWLLQRRRQSRP